VRADGVGAGTGGVSPPSIGQNHGRDASIQGSAVSQAERVQPVSAPAATPGTADDSELLGRLAAGEQDEPLRTLYRRYGGRIYGLGLQLLGDRGMAEELVQETFLRLWRSARRFDAGRGSARTFIFTLARRAAIDMRRRAAARPQERPRDFGSDESAELAVDDARFDQVVLSLDVRDAIDLLSEKHREVLELHYRRDLTQQQIAERLECPVGTVKTRTYYALRALKLELEERGIDG
jgi:RNA polymerase sigma-70 factor (ECF subfamily)